MNPYNEEIDKKIIEILYKEGKELTFRELKDQLKPKSKTTYSDRLKQLSKSPESTKDNKQSSKYVIQPVLNRRDDTGRGGKVYYSLTEDSKIRCDLKLPILKSESLIEKAYRILFRYLAFENSNYRKLEDENEYNYFLQKLSINKNELQLDGKLGYNRNLYKVTTLLHPISEIKFRRVDYLEHSDKNGKSEYYYRLPGISIKEFIANKESGLAYGHLSFIDNEISEYFKLLEDKKLIEKVKSLALIRLEEDDRYIIVDKKDNRLKKFIQECWLIHGGITALYLIRKWRFISPPTDEEKIWYEHLWGRQRTRNMLSSCYRDRIEFRKTKNQDLENKIQKELSFQISGMRNKFESIKKEYADIIKEYSYFAEPLLNLVFPEFLRNKI